MDELDQAAKLLSRGFAQRLHGHMGMDDFVLDDSMEINVEDAALDVVVLNFLHEGKVVLRGSSDLQ